MLTITDHQGRTAEFRNWSEVAQYATANDDNHEHHFEWQPSGRGIGFDFECACGDIKNARPVC